MNLLVIMPLEIKIKGEEPKFTEFAFFFPSHPGHMINMAAMPIYGKIFLKSSPEPVNR